MLSKAFPGEKRFLSLAFGYFFPFCELVISSSQANFSVYFMGHYFFRNPLFLPLLIFFRTLYTAVRNAKYSLVSLYPFVDVVRCLGPGASMLLAAQRVPKTATGSLLVRCY